jgi:hypothetical protein
VQEKAFPPDGRERFLHIRKFVVFIMPKPRKIKFEIIRKRHSHTAIRKGFSRTFACAVRARKHIKSYCFETEILSRRRAAFDSFRKVQSHVRSAAFQIIKVFFCLKSNARSSLAKQTIFPLSSSGETVFNCGVRQVEILTDISRFC